MHEAFGAAAEPTDVRYSEPEIEAVYRVIAQRPMLETEEWAQRAPLDELVGTDGWPTSG